MQMTPNAPRIPLTEGKLCFFFVRRAEKKIVLKRKQTFSFKQFFFVSVCIGVWITSVREQRPPAKQRTSNRRKKVQWTLFKLCQGRRFVVGVNANYNRLMHDIVFSFFFSSSAFAMTFTAIRCADDVSPTFQQLIKIHCNGYAAKWLRFTSQRKTRRKEM